MKFSCTAPYCQLQSILFEIPPPSKCDGQQDETGCTKRHERTAARKVLQVKAAVVMPEPQSTDQGLAGSTDELFPKLSQAGNCHYASISSSAQQGSPHIL